MSPELIIEQLKRDGKRFWAGDNIADYVTPARKSLMISKLTEKFGEVLDILCIDRENDPNSCLLYTSPSPRDRG